MFTKEEFDKMQDARDIAGVLQEKMQNHMSSVLEVHAKIYQYKFQYWCYPGTHESGMGELPLDSNIRSYMEELIDIEIADCTGLGCNNILDGFPLSWLFKTVEEVKLEIEEGIEEAKRKEKESKNKKAKQIEARKLAKAKAISSADEELIESAKSKLTNAEKKALGLNVKRNP